MTLSDQDVASIHAVADAVETIVVANCTQGRWRAGSGVSPATKSTLRAILDEDPNTEYLVGTAIDKVNQRAMMAAQPEVLRANIALLRAIDTSTPQHVAAAALAVAQLYNHTMRLKVLDPVPAG